ncbi:MAG TPA: gluconeogenesis factor YvcK family protein [Candidatus Saccharimonadales bacterium]|nr:gluconeogenesis factor YvcK family protein [Candidatus Saccharimonadales bacterium]
MKSKKASTKPKVVVIGGGTGTFVVLSGLKNYPVDLTAIVTMMDSGGSTGRLRDQLGVLPPGDLRQALVALSSSDKIWRDLFAYRFDAGDLNGHNFGNIFLSALEKITGSINTGLNLAEQILDTRGSVIPVTLDKSHLCVRLKNGNIIEGETFIDEVHVKRVPIENCFLKPQALPNPTALKAIEQADFIIFGPGDLYTSIIPNFLVTGIAATIKLSKAKKIFVSNLMTKFGQTDHYKISTHLAEIHKYLGANVVDLVMVNSAKPNKQLVDWYKKSGDVSMVTDDLPKNSKKVIRGDFLSETKYEQSLADRLKRSLIRHDSEKLAKALVDIFFK